MNRESGRLLEWDCRQLVINFYMLLDEKKYTELANLFAEDGVWVRLGVDLVGPEAIVAKMAEREDWLTTHLVSNVRFEVNGADEVNTTQYVTLYRHEGWKNEDGPAPVVMPLSILRHRDQLVRINQGWKFKRKMSQAIMTDRSRVTHYGQ
ncbi:MAG: nuclear transport factor 2 family protein [Pseudomonadota bacterium]|nr:nuclear transport factor 2 family protein [Pseudomonadota bacterium]